MKGKLTLTLAELLMILLIFGILGTITVSKTSQSDIQAKLAQITSELNSIGRALELYAIDYDGFYVFDIDSRGFPYYLGDTLTTPVAYHPNAPALQDPFREGQVLAPFGTRYR